MAKLIRATYPKEFSFGLLLLIFVLSGFLSSQIFKEHWRNVLNGSEVLLGMFLVGVAVVIMVLILWEEFLFPVHIKPTEHEVVFRNHRTKLKTQALIYFLIPAIFAFIYLSYEINYVRFILWASVCIIAPVAGKLISGIKNYNDFFKLTDDTIEYKNNEEAGVLQVKEMEHITLIKDERNVLHKVQVSMKNKNQIMIDLDEMELEAYYITIDKFISSHYKSLLNPTMSKQQF